VKEIYNSVHLLVCLLYIVHIVYAQCSTVSDLDLILKTTAVAGNSNFVSDCRATAARLIHCEGNFRFKPEHGTFFYQPHYFLISLVIF
jgi:hypothetical protein